MYKRKELVLLTESASSFYQNYYNPAIGTLACHLAHVKILDRLVAAFLTEIQSENLEGNKILPIEGLVMEYIDASAATTAAHTEKLPQNGGNFAAMVFFVLVKWTSAADADCC
eukprot:4326685-Ditylum_brightwellii.AAC.1